MLVKQLLACIKNRYVFQSGLAPTILGDGSLLWASPIIHYILGGFIFLLLDILGKTAGAVIACTLVLTTWISSTPTMHTCCMVSMAVPRPKSSSRSNTETPAVDAIMIAIFLYGTLDTCVGDQCCDEYGCCN